jgi:putative aldouronate transport system substrate-binding protein
MPATTEEFYQTLIAFRDNDPNRNGRKDEIPFIGTGINSIIFLINAFVYHPFGNLANDYLNVANGKIWAPWITEEYREALRYISKLYKEGLIAPATFTIRSDELGVITSIKEGEPQIVGAVSGNVSTIFIPETAAIYDYIIQPPLTGPKGVSYYPLRGNSIGPNAFITRDCINPEVAFRFLDFCWDPDAAMVSTYGEKDVDWQWLEPGFFGNMGDPATFERINLIGAMNHNKTWGDSPAMYWIDKVNNWSKFIDDGSWRAYRFKPYGQMGDLYEGKDASEKVSLIVYTKQENDRIRDVRTSIQTYREECLALFSTGQMDLERDWNTYLSNLDRIGLKTYLDTAQTAYTRTMGK